MSDIFLSYAREDRARAKLVVDALERKRWSVFWDSKIIPGQTWDNTIQNELATARCVIVLWSRDSVQSEYVKSEALAGNLRGILIPALLDDVAKDVLWVFSRTQSADLVGWSGELPHAGFDELARAVEAIVPPTARRGASAAPIGTATDIPQTEPIEELLQVIPAVRQEHPFSSYGPDDFVEAPPLDDHERPRFPNRGSGNLRAASRQRRPPNRLETMRFDTWRNDDKQTILEHVSKIVRLGDRVILPVGNGGGSLSDVAKWTPQIVNVCDDFLRMVEAGRKTKDSNSPTINKLGALGDSLASILRFSVLPTTSRVIVKQPILSQETSVQLDQILSRLLTLMRHADVRDRVVEDKAVRREVHSEERAHAAYDATIYGVSTLIDFRRFRSEGTTHPVESNFENILLTRTSRNKAITNGVIYMWWLAAQGQYEHAIRFGDRAKTLLTHWPDLPSGNAVAIIHPADNCEHNYASALANLDRTLGNAEIMCALEAGPSDLRHHIQKARQYIYLAEIGYKATASVWRHGIGNLTLSRAALAFVEHKYTDQKYENAHSLFVRAAGIYRETSDWYKTLKIMRIVDTDGKGVENMTSSDLQDLLFLE